VKKEVKANKLSFSRRDTGEKIQMAHDENIVSHINNLLDLIHTSMYNKAKTLRDEALGKTEDKNEFLNLLNARKMVLIPFCQKKYHAKKKYVLIHNNIPKLLKLIFNLN